ncbi:MAG: hypothetical protein WBN75_06500 [Verrucomicrobiia bacterium]
MSYDIYFWREQSGAKIDPEQVLSDLEDTVEFPGIVALPLDTLRQAFRQVFPDITDGGSSLDWEGDGSYFQVGFTFLDERTVSLTTICCGYELLKSTRAIQRLTSVASSLGCRVYDPQQT